MSELRQFCENYKLDIQAKITLILTHLQLEGYTPDIALRIAETQAQEWYKHRISKMDNIGNIIYVMPHAHGWIVQRALNIKHQSQLTYETCKRATECALEIAKQKRCHVIVFYENGEVRGRYYLY